LYRVEIDLSLTAIEPSTATEFADYAGTLFTNDGLSVFEEAVQNIRVPTPATAPEVTITGGNWEPGLYSILTTYRNTDGLEGGTSPVIQVELAIKGEILIYPSEIPGFTSTIYVTEAGGEVFYELGQPNQLSPANINANPFPTGADKLEWFESKLFVSEPMGDYTIVWHSKPFQYHLFEANNAYFVVPGRVEVMRSTQSAILIGTTERIYAYTTDGGLDEVAKYGVVPGQSVVKLPTDELFVYTQRGVCKAFPFTALTESTVSLPTGTTCATALMYNKGISKFVALHDADTTAFNAFDNQ
jgi:hypothetical protein